MYRGLWMESTFLFSLGGLLMPSSRNIYVVTSSDSPHILPFSTEPGLQDRKAFLASRDFGSATIISEDTWKLDSGCLASVLFSRLVSCSSVRRSLL